MEGSLNNVDGGPGFSVEALLTGLDEGQLSELLGIEMVGILKATGEEDLPLDRLRRALADVLDLREWLLNAEKRARMFRALPLAKAQELLMRLGLDQQPHPYQALENLSPSLTRSQVADVLGFFGLQWAEETPIRRLPGTGGTSVEVCPQYGLFEFQRLTLRQVSSAMLESTSVLLHMPTGSGKTRTAMHLVSEHLRVSEGTLVFWLSEQPEVLEQAADAFTEAWRAMGNRKVNLHRAFGPVEIDLDGLGEGVVLGGFQKLDSLQSRAENALLSLGDRTSLVVVDEAHQAIAPTYGSVIRALARKRPGTRLLGLTATPGRTWRDVDEDLRLSEFFGSRKVTIKTPGDRNPIEYLIGEGYLAKPSFRHVELAIAGSQTPGADGELAPAMDNARLIGEALTLFTRHRRLILFAASVQQARLLSAVLRLRGIVSEVITAQTPEPVRQLAYHRFRRSSIPRMALVNYGVLTTGFDAPSASCAIIARPTRSLVLFSQMVGRVLRGPRANGTPTAEVLTTIDTELPGFGSVSEAFHNWEDVWDEH